MCSPFTLTGSQGTVLGVSLQPVTVVVSVDVHNKMENPPALVLTLTMAPNAPGDVEGIQGKVQAACGCSTAWSQSGQQTEHRSCWLPLSLTLEMEGRTPGLASRLQLQESVASP